MTYEEAWNELRESITELRDNGGTGTQQQTCKFLANLMGVLEKQITDGWIPIICREPTDEEKESYFEQNGEELCYMIDNPMPYNGQEVLVSDGNTVAEDVFDEDFWNFENWDIENVVAWMPLPEPYQAEKESEE